MTTRVPIRYGGTGANTAVGARDALGVPPLEAYGTANNAYVQANAAYDAANTANSNALIAYAQANLAYEQANTARSDANTTFGTVNASIEVVNATFGIVNSAVGTINTSIGIVNTSIETINTAFGVVNASIGITNATFGAVNTAVTNAHNQANSAYLQANNAYDTANLKLNLTGGTINGSLNVSGNLTITGNTTYQNVTTYIVDDPLIYLAANNETSDLVDIGFMGGHNTSGVYQHSGLVRDAGDGTWYLFTGLAEEGHENNVVDFANTSLATLRANINANSILLTGNLTFSGTGQRIIGDFSGTRSDRVLFQTSTVNGATRVGIIPNGTSNVSEISINTNSDATTNLSVGQLVINATEFRIASANGGGGAYLPITFFTGGSERMRLDTGGNVSIGTTSTAAKLGVVATGQTPVSFSMDNSYFVSLGGNQNSSTIGISFGLKDGSGNLQVGYLYGIGGANPDLRLMAPGANNGILRFGNNNGSGGLNEYMTIGSTGNIGIGTTSPSFKLHVYSANNNRAIFETGSGGGINYLRLLSNNGGGNYGSSIEFRDGSTDSAQITSVASGQLRFSTAGAERVTIDSSGNFGIGTTSPLHTLHVGDGANTISMTGVSPVLAVKGALYNTGFVVRRDGYAEAGIRSSSTGEFGTWNNYDMLLVTNGTEHMRIDTSGRVGIGGVVGAAAKLVVGGTFPTSSAQTNACFVNGTIPSGTTSTFRGFYSNATTEAASFTLTHARMFEANPVTIGAGSALTNLYGFFVGNALTTATNNFGFYSGIASGTGRWNFYANGTADNYFAGNVGIGMAPVYALDLTVGPSNGIRLNASSGQCNIFLQQAGVTNGYINAAGGAGTDLIIVASRFLNLNGGSGGMLFRGNSVASESMRITPSGNLCIGTTGVVWDELLRVRPNSNTAVGVGVYTESAGYTGSLFRAQSETANGEYMLYEGRGAGGAVNYWVKGNGNAYFAGNVSIGTSNPAGYKVRIAGTSGAAQFRAGTDANGYFEINAFDNNPVYCVIAGATATAGVFGTQSNIPTIFFSNNTERMRIDANGNVGIGTSSPSSKLHVQSSAISPAQFWMDNYYYVGFTGNQNSSAIGFSMNVKDASGNFQFGYVTAVGGSTPQMAFIAPGSSNGLMLFGRNNGSGGLLESMRFSADGEVLVGGSTDNGAYNLQVNGTGVWGAGAYVNGSDRKLKRNIKPLDAALEVVKNIKPVTFQYNEDYSKDQNIQTGFIAQELLEVLEGKDYADGIVQQGPEYLNVAYQSLIPILVKAIQELTARVAELEAKS